MAVHLTRSECEESKAVDGTDDEYIMEWQWRDMGMLLVSLRRMKALTMKMETMTLIGKGRKDLTCFVH